MKKNDGGPAFPVHDSCADHNGMTLRDWFATHAPEPTQEWLDLQRRSDMTQNPHNDHHKPPRRDVFQLTAEWKMKHACAMLKAREGEG